jgi:hypothetical protein
MRLDLLPKLHESGGFVIADATPSSNDITTHIGKGCIAAMAVVTHIPYRRLKDWSLPLLTNVDWRPYDDSNAHRRPLNKNEEAEVLQELHDRSLSKGIDWPQQAVHLTVKKMWTASHARSEEIEEEEEWSGLGEDEEEG